MQDAVDDGEYWTPLWVTGTGETNEFTLNSILLASKFEGH